MRLPLLLSVYLTSFLSMTLLHVSTIPKKQTTHHAHLKSTKKINKNIVGDGNFNNNAFSRSIVI